MSSSLSQLCQFKETTLHWFLGGRNDEREERGTACGSQIFISAATLRFLELPLLLWFCHHSSHSLEFLRKHEREGPGDRRCSTS